MEFTDKKAAQEGMEVTMFTQAWLAVKHQVSSWDGDPGLPPLLQTSQNISFGSHITHLSLIATVLKLVLELRGTPATIPFQVAALQSFRWDLPWQEYDFNHMHWRTVPFMGPCFFINSVPLTLIFTHRPDDSCCLSSWLCSSLVFGLYWVSIVFKAAISITVLETRIYHRQRFVRDVTQMSKLKPPKLREIFY